MSKIKTTTIVSCIEPPPKGPSRRCAQSDPRGVPPPDALIGLPGAVPRASGGLSCINLRGAQVPGGVADTLQDAQAKFRAAWEVAEKRDHMVPPCRMGN
jgi:hypothetical protein